MRALSLVLIAWMTAAPLDAVAGAKGLTPEAVDRADGPVSSRSSRAAVARLQILLDRAGTTPGAIDGRWGANTTKAIEAFQAREGLRATRKADRRTMSALARRAGDGDAIVERELIPEDVEGPFAELPDDVYARAELDCLCYESPSEKLAERFHTTPSFLAELNPGVDLDALAAGDRLLVPAVRRQDPRAEIERLVVHKEGGFLRALDRDGAVLLHFPVTVGAAFAESPAGTYAIEKIARNPGWHFQPEILESVDDSLEDAHLPPGPNSPVGAVWIALSKPTYGIHGTDAPETIGYASSDGCVRMTNWDALFLAQHVREKLPVEFVD
jgi:lipoprotein-anchoring transpeptidase ErfK/SrfK